MHRRTLQIAKVFGGLLLVAATFSLGLKVGVHWGHHQFLMMDSSAKATLLVGELRALRAGRAEKLIEGKEVELDAEIVKAMAFRDSGHGWIFWPFDGAYEHARYLRNAAKYRSEFPASVPELPIKEGTPISDEMKTFGHLVRERTAELVRDYGQ